jgi:hypothetical protein
MVWWSSDLCRSDFGVVPWPSRITNKKATVVKFVAGTGTLKPQISIQLNKSAVTR